MQILQQSFSNCSNYNQNVKIMFEVTVPQKIRRCQKKEKGVKEFHGSLGADFCQQRLQFSSLRATSVTNWSETGRHCRDASKG